mgnify:CR=1 FL=1
MKKEVKVTIDHLTKDGVGVAKIDKKPLYVKIALQTKRFVFVSIMKEKEIYMVIFKK